MHVDKLRIQNFRGLADVTLGLDRSLTVIVGVNGSGKSSVLDALAIALSQYVARLTKSAASSRRITDADVRIGAARTEITAYAEDEGDQFQWSILKQEQRERVLRPSNSDLRGVSDLSKKVAERSDPNGQFLEGETPVVYYNQRRAVIDIPQRKRGQVSHKPVDAFAESLQVGGIDFRKLTYWFQERETEELRYQKKDREYVDRQLEAVRKAITTATGLKDPYYRIEGMRGLCFTKERVELHASQLSTGEKVFMALAADLARRLAVINPSARDATRSPAIVLIDEVELHLHPAWQRKIAAWLTETFPSCQFVITTHSPQVVGEVPASQLRVLTLRRGRTTLTGVRASLGRDTNYILAAVFGVDERKALAKNKITDIDGALNRGDLNKAQALIEQLSVIIEGDDPQIAIAEARLARRTHRRP